MYDNEVKEVRINYEKWLEMSHLTEAELLDYKTAKEFLVTTVKDKEYSIVMIGIENNGDFTKIGEQFIYKTGDAEAFLDIVLLLFYIAQRLDEANEKLPKFAQRKRYFYLKVKDFINDEKKLLQKK